MADVIIIAGFGLGDEGKGSICDALVRQYRAGLVVRHNGGAQAAHNVVEEDGRHHTFSQFGSGTLVPGCETHLSRFMVFNPLFLMSEEQHLRSIGVNDALDRLTIDRDALVTSPFQVAANRLRELSRGNGRHGSCGLGISETVGDSLILGSDTIRAGDLEDIPVLRSKLRRQQDFKLGQLAGLFPQVLEMPGAQRELDLLQDTDIVDFSIDRLTVATQRAQLVDGTFLRQRLLNPGPVIFEGAQGMLLDEDFGFFPYVTRSRTGFTNALELVAETGCSVRRLGLVRSYMTRHGSGPFVTEDPKVCFPDHNCYGPWQQGWRQGHFDLVALDYAVRAAGGVDEMGVTHMDRCQGPQKVCTSYGLDLPLPSAPLGPARLKELEAVTRSLFEVHPTYQTLAPEVLLERIAATAQAPITITSSGPTASTKTFWT